MTRRHNLLLVSLILSFPAYSGTIEVAQWIPWNFISKEIISTPIEVRVSEPQFEMQIQELKPVANNLQISIDGGISNLAFNQNGMSASENLKAEIHMDSLKLDQIIRRVFNGNIIEVHMEAVCTPIHIMISDLRAETHSVFVNNQSYWRPELMDVEINIPANAWSVSNFTCSGIGGVGEEIASQIKTALTNPAMFRSIIKDWLAVEIRSAFLTAWNSLLMSTGKDIKVTSMAKPGDQGVVVYGELPTKTSRMVQLPSINPAQLSAANPQLIISDKGFEALLEDKFLAMAPQRFNLQKVDGFAKLMKSRLTQYFVWPDLRRFNSSTPFLMSSNTNESQLSLKQETNNQWTAYLNSNGMIQTAIGGSEIDYINFGMTVTTKMTASVKDSKITIANGASDLQLKWSYGLLYSMLYRPNNRIAIDILKGALNGFFSNQSVVQDLPIIKIDNQEWKLQNWKQTNNLITMDWL
jgi:hypothetical protein